MLSLFSQFIAFVISVCVVSGVSRHLHFVTGGRAKPVLGGVLAGIVTSIISDFTFSYATPGYDRDIEAVIARAIASALFSAALSFIMTMKRFRHQ
jgi:hypothetical protein